MTKRNVQIRDSNVILYEEFSSYAQTKSRGLDFVWEIETRQPVRGRMRVATSGALCGKLLHL